MELCKLVEINQQKCTNCHVCISVCPVKYCLNDEKTVTINPNLCIGCGRCYKACPHGAINYVDDFNYFIESLNKAKKVILIISPAFLMNYNDSSKNFIGWLRKNFILEGIFDESFGAEISAYIFQEYFKKNKKIPVITQQCPSVVEYLKIYKPNLLSYLPPIHSPSIITAMLIRKILNYKGLIAYLGPCLSKRREFLDTESNNQIQFNIVLESISKYIKDNNVDIFKFNESDFDFIPAEIGKTFCKPGGLINVLKKTVKNKRMINIEGKILYSKHFKDFILDIDNNFQSIPTIIDLLNCEGGCYHGPGIINTLSFIEETWLIDKIENESKDSNSKENKSQKIFEKVYNENKELNFHKKYSPKNQESIYTLNNEELKNTYNSLNKHENKDFLNCQSCGFDTCQEFATSCFFKKNNSTNCRVYIESKLNKELHETMINLEELSIKIKKLFSGTTTLDENINNIKYLFNSLENLVKSIINFNSILKENTEKFQPIITAISEVSEQINLLSFNASIEASRTGELGKGFTVVASEIRNLADKTKIEIDKINPIIQTIISSTSGLQTNTISLSQTNNDFNKNLNTLTNLLVNINLNINNLFESLDNKK